MNSLPPPLKKGAGGILNSPLSHHRFIIYTTIPAILTILTSCTNKADLNHETHTDSNISSDTVHLENRTDVDTRHLEDTDTETALPEPSDTSSSDHPAETETVIPNSTDSEKDTFGDTTSDDPPIDDDGGDVDEILPTNVAFQITHQLTSDIDSDAPGTIGIVSWSINVAPIDSATIQFGLDTNYGFAAPVDLEEPQYRTLLLGLKPEKTYHFKIVAKRGSAIYESDDFTFETGPPTDLVAINNFNVLDDTSRAHGFILVAFWRGENSNVAFVLDPDGEIVWWHAFALDQGNGGICRIRMSADGKRMWMVVSSNQGGIVRNVTMDSLTETAYEETRGSHDITPVSGSTMAYIDYGEDDCDSIYEIDPYGVIGEVFEGEGVISEEEGLIGGGCHLNALRYSKTEEVYTVSNLSADVYVIDRLTGNITWRLTELVGSNDIWGGPQHGHHLLDQSFLIFANRGGEDSNSAVFEFSIDSGEISMSYDSGLVAQNMGDVQRIPGGNTLVSYSNRDTYIHEIDPEGNLVLEIDLGTEGDGPALGYPLWRQSLYGSPSDIEL